MIGNFLTRGLVMILGYAYPAYECYKTVEKNKPEIEQLRFWCQYWILVALMTVFERAGDAFVSWLPMYSEAKLAFIIYLWYPKTKGTTYVYDSFFKPYVAKHETEIDRNLVELRIRAGDMAFTYCQKAATYGQTRVFEILQYVAAQSTSTSRPSQRPRQVPKARQPPTTSAAPPPPKTSSRSLTTQPKPQPLAENEKPQSPTSSSTSSSRQSKEVEDGLNSTLRPSTSAPPPASLPGPSQAPSPLKKAASLPAAPESSNQSATNDNAEPMQIEPDKSGKRSLPTPEETVMEETIRVTRGRLRKTRSTTTTK